MRIRSLLLVFLLAALAPGLRATGPAFWTVAASADFLRGTSNGVYVNLDGVVSPGPQLTSRLTTTPAQIWSLAAAPDSTLWAGTGGDGRVIRIRPGQPEETVFHAAENNVFAIAVAGDRVYAATSPDGRVYVIDASGTARPFFDPPEKYIWALAVDSAGRLWVGAGSPAVIYRVTPSGTSSVVYKPPASHVVCLAPDSEGRMLAGTESPGRLYRIDANDHPFVVLDSDQTELAAIAPAANGVVFAAAVSHGGQASTSGDTASVAVTVESAQTTSSSASTTASASSTASSSPHSVVYRIEANGTWEPLWDTDDVIYDLSAFGDGGVLAASGPDGRLYRIGGDRQVQLLTGVDAKQIVRFAGTTAADGVPMAFATANPGRVIVTGGGIQSPATYVSEVHDTKSVSTWGIIRWNATGSVALYTRSGNTGKPDDSWSDWAGPYATGAGEPVRSPAARFVQWKAVLTGTAAAAAPALTSVTMAYLTRNSRPTVDSITVSPPGVVFQRPFTSDDGAIAGLDDAVAAARRPPGDQGPPSPGPGRRMYQKGLQTISWKADDADDDRLSYSLQYRRIGDQVWHDLRSGLTDTIFVWDTTSVPDGRYIVRVVASDAPSNAAGRALTGERESDPIDIDNTPPTMTIEVRQQNGTTRLLVDVRDAQSPIEKLEYSVGGGPWQVVYPVDGLADSPEEHYDFVLPAGVDAAHVVLRATDILQNVASQSAGRN
jgi:PQQ-like domain/Two component regulator propeller